MKYRLSWWVCLCLLCWASQVWGQSNLATQFNLYETDDQVQLTWVIGEGNICQGIEVERSTDGSNFAPIGRIDGVCGSFTGATRFEYLDLSPVANQVNHYRLLSQNSVISAVISIEVVALGANNALIRPNPVVDQAVIYFENAARQLHLLQVFDAQGVAVQTLITNLERFDLDARTLQSGIYVLVIRSEDGENKAKGRLVVVH